MRWSKRERLQDAAERAGVPLNGGSTAADREQVESLRRSREAWAKIEWRRDMQRAPGPIPPLEKFLACWPAPLAHEATEQLADLQQREQE